MKGVKSHQEEEEEEKEATPSSSNTKETASPPWWDKVCVHLTLPRPHLGYTDGKNNDKANAIRSKHSVTEQRRRSKINERFQILRDLIPHSDQKRDTASFLLEVIQYVQYLQEKVQKYEGSYQPWSSEPTKLMPWRNSHWRMQSLPAHPQALKNGTGPESTYLGRFDENAATVTSTMQPNQQNAIESHPSRDISFRAMDQHNELANKAITTPMPLQAGVPVPLPNNSAFSDSQPRPLSDECRDTVDAMNHHEDLTVDGGTISISSPYSQGLLDSLTEALQSAGLDLSQATISVQINFGKRANRGMTSGASSAKDNENTPTTGNQHMDFREANSDEDLDRAQKRLKI